MKRARKLMVIPVELGEWEIASNIEEGKVFIRPEPGGHTGRINNLIFFENGEKLVSASDDKTIRIWSIFNSKKPRLSATIRGEMGKGNPGKIYAIAIDPSERLLAAGGHLPSREIRIHDLETGEILQTLKGHDNVVFSLAFSPDGQYLVSGAGDSTAIVWKLEGDRYHLHKRLEGHQDNIYALSISSNRLAIGSYDATVRLYDINHHFKLIRVLKDHRDRICSVAFSPDEKYLVTGSDDKRILLYDPDGNLIKEFSNKRTIPVGLSFTPDGRYLLSGSLPTQFPVTCYLYHFPSGKVRTAFKKHKNSVFAVAATLDEESK